MQQIFNGTAVKSEKLCVEALLRGLDWDGARAGRVSAATEELILAMRAQKRKNGSVESFFQTYGLDTEEGIALMCLAEALLRIPDAKTANELIRDKIAGTAWVKTEARKDDWMLRMAGMGLSVTRSTLDSPVARLGAPVIRAALGEAMKILGGQFVLGRTIDEALKNASFLETTPGYVFSYDMLGEGARTAEDAERYFEAYEAAIDTIGQNPKRNDDKRPGISVKLSALYPRYQFSQEADCVPALTRQLEILCRKASAYNICLTVDAEESERLETSLKIIRNIIQDVTFTGWDGFGLAVQAYDKRAPDVIDRLIGWTKEFGKHLQIRLVKGAYWDSEIKRAQIKGLEDYPVYTQKHHTDLSYLLCAQKMLAARQIIYPMFGTHNAHTVRAILDLADGNLKGFEFQRLFGMGESLYDITINEESVPVRIYAPVGKHQDLLPYLVRRLLENGANSSFVNKVFDGRIDAGLLSRDTLEKTLEKGIDKHPRIPLPIDLFGVRQNSRGIDFDHAENLQNTLRAMDVAFETRETFCGSLVSGQTEKSGNPVDILNPSDTNERVGTAYFANEQIIEKAFDRALKTYPAWSDTPSEKRAKILNTIADLYEEHGDRLMSLCVHEAGKTLPDALAEIREAVDFCRYYAHLGEQDFSAQGKVLTSYTGESNRLILEGRGAFVCISPWNFPLAIFTGQVVAALMAGNAVLAKPAEQTPFIAQAAVELMHKAGVPKDILHLIIGDGRVGEMLVSHKDVAGVAFTGSTNAAWSINRTLAAKDGPIVPFIAETGGQNAIIADSSALTEQVVDDVILSAFGSAGQRCSACRVLFLQEEIADKTITMLQGAMAELKIGNPQIYSTDIGPLIDEEALATLQRHKTSLEGFGKFVAEAPLSEELKKQGHFFAPIAYEIDSLADLKEEVFGPALHIIRYQASRLDDVVRMINESNFGLTFGVHTRIDALAQKLSKQVMAGNIYVNRSIIGAVVGVQPFGGRGLSGTGPKAGGPYYLHRFANEKAISTNTTAAGGNASLVMLEE
jgi:RHH-type proline utilization regulon transcriptional repressor/proline dehydrogenase/delta 1-pyrroline-5-carboxylate dehydrogenase